MDAKVVQSVPKGKLMLVDKMQRNQEEINCKTCNKLTQKYVCSDFNRPRKFCSPECYYSWKKINPKKGKFHHCWKGENCSYSTKHKRLYSTFGKANKCENKNCTYKNPKRFEWANISGKYLRDRSDWQMLCTKCHHLYDFINFGARKEIYKNVATN